MYTESFSSGPTPGETFAVYSRNADGTVGNDLFNDFTLSYDSVSHNTTATATSPFIFQASTSYWLMMVETPERAATGITRTPLPTRAPWG